MCKMFRRIHTRLVAIFRLTDREAAALAKGNGYVITTVLAPEAKIEALLAGRAHISQNPPKKTR